MTTCSDLVSAYRRGAAAVSIDGVTLPVTGVACSEEALCVTVDIGDECMVLDLGEGVKFIDLEQRCPNCAHPLSEHENGRCTHLMMDGGYNTDYICSCCGAERGLSEEEIAGL